MKKLVVSKKYNNKKLSSFLFDMFNGLSSTTFYKTLRKKDIIVNGRRIKENVTVYENDEIIIYITDEFLFKTFNIETVYEDDNIVVINKPAGIEVVSETRCRFAY